MFDKLKFSLVNLASVFSKIKYLLFALVFGFLFYLLNFLISAFGNISSFYKTRGFTETLPFLFNLFVNFKGSILPSSFFSMLALSALTGILFALIAYKINFKKNISPNAGILGTGGMFLGIFAPGCASCGLGFAAFFGLTGAFATLPLQGLEISILAIGILAISILIFSYKLNENACLVKVHSKKIETGIINSVNIFSKEKAERR